MYCIIFRIMYFLNFLNTIQFAIAENTTTLPVVNETNALVSVQVNYNCTNLPVASQNPSNIEVKIESFTTPTLEAIQVTKENIIETTQPPVPPTTHQTVLINTTTIKNIVEPITTIEVLKVGTPKAPQVTSLNTIKPVEQLNDTQLTETTIRLKNTEATTPMAILVTQKAVLLANALNEVNSLLSEDQTKITVVTTQPTRVVDSMTTDQQTTPNPQKRETQEPPNLDPTKVADPSLEAITLSQPNYRTLNTEATTSALTTTTKKSSSTIMGMGGGAEAESVPPPTTIATLAPADTEIKKAEAEVKIAEAEANKAEAEAKKAELEAFTAIYPVTTTTATEAPKTTQIPLNSASEIPNVIVSLPDFRNSDDQFRFVKTLSETIGNSSKLLFQNITVVLPNFNPPAQNFFDSLFQNRYGSSGQAFGSALNENGFLGVESALIDNEENVKVLDASYEPEGTSMDPASFQASYYAKWSKLMEEKKGLQFDRSHIPGAIHFNLNVATYPTWNEKQALYPPDLFAEYAQMLGINRNDRLIVYARGPLGGFLHAARIYGHENVQVLDGGLEAWRRADFPSISSSNESSTKQLKPGDWIGSLNGDLLVTFEELSAKQTDGYCVFSRLFWYNFLDARPRNEFFGFFGNSVFGQQRSRISSTKPMPADELIRSDGFFAKNAEILQKLQTIGFVQTRQTIVAGNTADEASVVLLALKLVGYGNAKLYNGGLEEIRIRAPQLISSR